MPAARHPWAMDLTPQFLDELRARTSLEGIVGRHVVWDARKSNRARGDLWAPCPFHHEKTPSFHIEEAKGRYYCFGCQAKGDAITFLREIEGLEFLDAVRQLADAAGLDLPQRTPGARRAQDRRGRLAEVVEAGIAHARLMLTGRAGTAARDYLRGRGLTPADLDRFEIGYLPAARTGLLDALAAKGIDARLAVDSGLCAAPEDGGAPYDRFRDRVTFPIRDGRGRAVSLGGRAMSPDARAKYLNGPQTELFDKGRTLYNQRAARLAVGKGAPLILAEGYMDVIALARAGLDGAVAPLGTAITETQLAMLWKMAEEPVVALDGDGAGLRSAMRLMDLALPLLAPGRSLRFALLPPGKDPDDLLREGGPAALEAAMAATVPLIDMLWRRETEGVDLRTPERRAKFDQSLRELVRQIKDDAVRRHYGKEVGKRRGNLFEEGVPRRGLVEENPRFSYGKGWRDRGRGVFDPPRGPSSGFGVARRTLLGSAASTVPPPKRGTVGISASGEELRAHRERVILATMLTHPVLYETLEDQFGEIDFSPANDAMAGAVKRCRADPDACERLVGREALESLWNDPHVRLTRLTGETVVARALAAQEIAKLTAARARRAEIAEIVGEEDPEAALDDARTYRLGQVAGAAEAAFAALGEDAAAFDVAENGLQLDREERARAAALYEGLGLAPGKGAA